MEPQQQEIPAPVLNGEEWRAELNAAESLAGQLRDRLKSLKQKAGDEAGKTGDRQVADWCESAMERLDNGISEAGQISDALAALDGDLPEFNRP